MNKVLKTYPDGSELTVGLLALAYIGGAIGATTIYISTNRIKKLTQKARLRRAERKFQEKFY